MRQTVQIEAAQTVLIDALLGVNFSIRLTTSIETLLIKNVSPGQLYVFILEQDQVGGRIVKWGTQVLNASSPNPAPHSFTRQCFIGNQGGTLQANLAAAWSQG